MIAYFKKLFDYDRYVNDLIIDTMLSSGTTIGKPVELMAHLLAAHQRWLTRCKYQPAPGGSLWPDWPLEALKAIIEQNYQDWMAYLDTLHDADMQQIITYQNSAGVSYSNTLDDVLAHLINHGTHHRAQAGQQLKFAGVDQLPVSDYIFYIRGLK